MRMSIVTLALLSGCAVNNLYPNNSEAQLDAQARICRNGNCRYELAMAYFRVGANYKGWAYMDLSARDGFPFAQQALVQAGRPVPPVNPGL